MADWDMLPYDILGEIAMRLDTIDDFAYFSSVCRSWNYASSLVKRKWRAIAPCLLLAENTKENPLCRRKIWSITNHRCFEFMLPQTFGARCWGSSTGWIVTLDINLEVYLFNPLTKARLTLPPVSEMPCDRKKTSDEAFEFYRVKFVNKAIVLNVGQSDRDDYIVFVMCDTYKKKLAFARPGDQTWTSIYHPWNSVEIRGRIPANHRVAEVVCHGTHILILYEDASLGYLSVTDLSKIQTAQHLKAIELFPTPTDILDLENFDNYSLYMVNSFGSILMILRYKDDIYDESDKYLVHDTTFFEVYQLDFDYKKWDKAVNLDKVALFVGDSCSMSIRASNVGNCNSNHIYFTDDDTEDWNKMIIYGRQDIGSYDIANDNFEKFYEDDDLYPEGEDDNAYEDYNFSAFCTSLWFMPQF